MALARNLSNAIITTITAGNISPNREKKIEDWEGPILEMLHGKKVLIIKDTPIQKKGKK